MAKLNLKMRATVSCNMEVEITSREALSEPKVNALTRPSLLDCLKATADVAYVTLLCVDSFVVILLLTIIILLIIHYFEYKSIRSR